MTLVDLNILPKSLAELAGLTRARFLEAFFRANAPAGQVTPERLA
jgi:hypothetical protein